VGEAEFDLTAVHSLSEHTIAPGRLGERSQLLRQLPGMNEGQLNELIGWLQTTMGVLQATVGTTSFLEKASQALVDIVGLDLGRVLLLERNEWRVEAAAGGEPEGGRPWQPSRLVLAQVREKRRTCWVSPRQTESTDSPSLGAMQTVVAAPILNADDQVIGALYGERRKFSLSRFHSGGKVEAMLVEMLACGVATGLARQAHERAALEARVRFEQFFGPHLARRLANEPNLLESRQANVTCLFADVRGFSRISEKLDPAETVRWMNDLMSELSRCVLDEQGVLVDYVGDELLAMWGAPEKQPDHEERAVRAALAMLAELPAVSARWQAILGEPVEIGIGLNSGPARVGNTGSRYKFKYGPLGNTVNLASRVQGLTRYLKCPLLVTQDTRARLGSAFYARRVVKTRVVNIEEPVDLYEIVAVNPERAKFFAESEAALKLLEAGEFAQAARKAGMLLDNRGDGPLLLILSRASEGLVTGGRGFNPIWEPPGK
jgi:adenylate cyclase